MASPAQISANRLNARKSTGPQTAVGKRKIAANSVSHGLAGKHVVVPGEDPVAFNHLLESLAEEHQPASPTESFLVEELAKAQWKLRRIDAVEQEILARIFDPSTNASPIAATFLDGNTPAQALALLARYEGSARRAFHAALRQLQTIRADRRTAELHPITLRRARQSAAAQELREHVKAEEAYFQANPNSDPKNRLAAHRASNDLFEQYLSRVIDAAR